MNSQPEQVRIRSEPSHFSICGRQTCVLLVFRVLCSTALHNNYSDEVYEYVYTMGRDGERCCNVHTGYIAEMVMCIHRMMSV